MGNNSKRLGIHHGARDMEIQYLFANGSQTIQDRTILKLQEVQYVYLVRCNVFVPSAIVARSLPYFLLGHRKVQDISRLVIELSLSSWTT